MLTTTAVLVDEMHLFLASAGRWVLAVAATLFLAYVVLMTTVFLVSAVRGWVQAVSLRSHKAFGRGVTQRREMQLTPPSTTHLAKQS